MYKNLIIIAISVILCSVLLFIFDTYIYKRIEGAENVTAIDINTINSGALQNISSVYNNKHLIVDEITTKKINVLPVGSIIMWGKSADTIPDGWAVCNGQNDTPDLRDRFILASDSDFGGKGNGNIKLKASSTTYSGNHSHTLTSQICTHGQCWQCARDSRCANKANTGPGGNHRHKVTVNESNLGTNNLKPRYHKLIFIMRIR